MAALLIPTQPFSKCTNGLHHSGLMPCGARTKHGACRKERKWSKRLADKIISLLEKILARLEDAVLRCSLCNINPRMAGQSRCKSCMEQSLLSSLR